VKIDSPSPQRVPQIVKLLVASLAELSNLYVGVCQGRVPAVKEGQRPRRRVVALLEMASHFHPTVVGTRVRVAGPVPKDVGSLVDMAVLGYIRRDAVDITSYYTVRNASRGSLRAQPLDLPAVQGPLPPR
jgi:hypothetical protein